MNPKKLAQIAIYEKGALQKPRELTDLIMLLQDKDLNNVVEIGTGIGGSLYVLCQLAKDDAKIISIDFPNGPFSNGTIEDHNEYKTQNKKPNQELYFIIDDSHNESAKQKLVDILDNNQIDVLFIDGDHTHRGVEKDHKMYSPLVKDNGLIVFHDIMYHPQEPTCKVEEFWSEIKDKYKHLEFEDLCGMTLWHMWGGIGVLYNNKSIAI